jgi:carboxymethylenebutenolidase
MEKHPLHQYLAEEIAEDHAAGKISRREALRRLAFMGFSALSASALLAACGSDEGGDEAQPEQTAAPTTTTGGPSTTRGASTPVATQDITYPGTGGVTLRGVFAKASAPKGAVLVIHENQGISPFIRSFTGRLGGDGYSAIAVDLLSAEGGTPAFTDPATIGPALTRLASERSVDDMKSTLDELARREPSAKLGVTGFCFGGGMVWELLKAKDARLLAAVPCYGSVNNPDFAGGKAAVLGVYAQNDQRVNATRDAAKAALERAGLQHEFKEYPGVGHGFVRFIDDPSNASNAQAQVAYSDMLNWFARYLR